MAQDVVPYSDEDMAHVQSMDFGVLGSLEVVAEGETLELGPFKQRALLALLIVNANRVVSTDRILEALWGEEGADKENALWVYVSRLRSALEPNREGRGQSAVLVRRDPGYVLTVDPDHIDVHRFEAKLTEGRDLARENPESAIAAFEAALDWWRGGALEEFAYENFASTEIERLEELRIEAVEGRMGAALSLGQSGELVGELESLVRDHPFRERLVGQLMVALYRSGRQSEALRAFERHKRVVAEELGIEPSPELARLEEQILLHDPALASKRDAAPSLAASSIRNPYKGLLAFQEDDAADFYGREGLIADVLRRVDSGGRLVALVGPSGSGKSSVVRAGVLPRLRKGAVAGSDGWQIATMVPGAHPYAELEVALLRSTIDPPDSLAGQLDGGDDGILRAVLRVMSRDDGHLVLVIDQFEELFTLVDNPQTQKRFLNGLLAAVDDPRGRITVLVTLRADFYDKPLLHPAFGARLGEAVVNVTPLSTEELEEAATQPAVAADVALEPSLLAQLLADVVDQPGALPMFQYTLTELFERRADSVLLASEYHEMGGVRGAITHRADDVYDRLAPEEREATRQLFLRLVTLSADDSLSRRRVPASEITSLEVDVVALQTVLNAFGAARLLSFDRDRRTGAPTVEVGHEALLTEWERLSGWIKGSRQDLLRHASLATAVAEWEQSDRNPDYPVHGTRLTEFERFAATGKIDLNARELEYVGASIALRETDREAEEQRAAHEQQLRGRAKRRLWGLVALIAAVVVVVAAIGAIVWFSGKPTIALIAIGPRGASELDDVVYLGWDQAAREHGFDGVEVPWPYTAFEAVVADLAENGAELIIAVFPEGESESTMEAYPETKFVSIDRLTIGTDNSTAFMFAVHEGSFLAGAAAALTSDTGMVGFVGGLQFPGIIDPFRAGYEAGARVVNPSIEIVATHVGTQFWEAFASPFIAKRAANDMFDLGADVIFVAAGDSGLGVFEAAKERSEETGTKHWAIGVDSDQYLTVGPQLQPYVLTSAVKRLDAAVQAAVDDFMAGELVPGIKILTLSDGAVGYGSGGTQLETISSRLDELEVAIVAGEVEVPSIPEGVPLAPPGFDVEAVAAVVIAPDGSCTLTYAGPDPTEGLAVRFDITNRSDGPMGFTGWMEDPQSRTGGTDVLSHHETVLFVRLAEPTTWLCGPALDAPFEWPTVGEWAVGPAG